jgi:hypothetical protein
MAALIAPIEMPAERRLAPFQNIVLQHDLPLLLLVGNETVSGLAASVRLLQVVAIPREALAAARPLLFRHVRACVPIEQALCIVGSTAIRPDVVTSVRHLRGGGFGRGQQ